MAATTDSPSHPASDTPTTTSSDFPQKTPGSPIDASSDVPAVEAPIGESLVAPTAEPTPHESTNLEITQLKDPEVKDFGWNSKPQEVPSPLIRGLANEDLYTLIRRFNKQLFHVKAVDRTDELLDLEVSSQEEFSPDKLRATLERLYMTVIVGIAAFAKHIARLQSWNEPRRTAGFCLVYYVAWWYRMVMPAFIAMLIVLVLDPQSRKLLFPPAPLALVSSKTGNLQVPKAGTLGSKDSLSGAPEAHRGEAVEQEARHFVSGLASVAISTAAGKGPGEDGNGSSIAGGEAEADGVSKPATAIESAVPDPAGMAIDAAGAKDLASGDASHQDPAKKHVESAIWDKARPIMRGLTNAIDVWERFGNALSPTPPFPAWTPRLRLAGPLVPLMFLTMLRSADIAMRATSFLFGVVFFAQPLLIRGARWLTHKYPEWRKYLDLNKTLLLGVPTNAQLTLRLLRIAEQNKSPLPPPPTSLEPTVADAEDDADSFDESGYDVDTDTEENVSISAQDNATNGESESGPTKKRKPGRRIANVLKRTVKAGVGGALGVDHVKAKVGSEQAKQRLGAVVEPPPGTVTADGGPVDATTRDVARLHLPGGEGPCVFSARMHGKKGHVLLVNSATSPCVAFAYSKVSRNVLSVLLPGRHSDEGAEVEVHPEFTIGLSDIVELRKMGGFGWKGKMVIGWVLQREIVDGLEIVDKQGNGHILTAIKGRDELFNRLIAMGGQKWECW